MKSTLDRKKMGIVSEKRAIVLIFVGMFLFAFSSMTWAAPDGVSVDFQSNETKGSTAGYALNISGGYLATFNITATTQNPRWKAFVGQVTGTFTLDDSTGSTIYDWQTSTTGGEVYATRNSTTVNWNNLTCATVANLESENGLMGHANADDNLTRTFNNTDHAEFFVANVNVSLDSCRSLRTYVENSTQAIDFDEVALYEALGANVVYATIMEDDQTGFDSGAYDFQMIVPERGDQGNAVWTAYYLYVELS